MNYCTRTRWDLLGSESTAAQTKKDLFYEVFFVVSTARLRLSWLTWKSETFVSIFYVICAYFTSIAHVCSQRIETSGPFILKKRTLSPLFLLLSLTFSNLKLPLMCSVKIGYKCCFLLVCPVHQYIFNAAKINAFITLGCEPINNILFYWIKICIIIVICCYI